MENYLFLKGKEKDLSVDKKIFFYPKNFYWALRKYGLEPRSGILKTLIPDSARRVKNAPDPKTESATL